MTLALVRDMRELREPSSSADEVTAFETDVLARLVLALDGRTDGDVADFDVVGLFDGEGDGAGDSVRRDGERIAVPADLLTDLGIVDGVG